MSFGGRRMNLGAVENLVGGLEAGRRGWQRLVLRED